MTNDAKELKEIGSRIRKARLVLGLTQSEVAEKAGLSESYYAKVERGVKNQSLVTLKAILKVLKVSSRDVLTF